MTTHADLSKRLRNHRVMMNYGNGDVRDEPDEDCEQAASLIEAQDRVVREQEAEIIKLRAALERIGNRTNHIETMHSMLAARQFVRETEAIVRAALPSGSRG